MRTSVIAVLALLAGTIVMGAPAGADHVQTDPLWPCDISVDESSSENPHLVDPSGDWDGLTGNGNEAGLGEIYREGIDIENLWFDRTDGVVRANVQIANLAAVQPNTIFYVIWFYPDGDSTPLNGEIRWASARLKEYADPVFTYGYMSTSATGGLLFFSEGETTGSLTRGEGAVATIDLTAEALNGAHEGDYLIPWFDGDLTPMESRILLGSPESLPEPSPFRHGFVNVADTAENFVGNPCNVLL